MLRTCTILILLGATGFAVANEPQTTLRGAVNGVSLQPAPANVARGGILAVFGEELASAHTVAEEGPLPVSLEDPAVQVLVNGVAAPLFFVSPAQINAQVPWEVEPGWGEVVVRRGDSESAAMPVIVSDVAPSLIRHEGSSAPIAQTFGGPPDPASAPASTSAALELDSTGLSPSATGAVMDASAAIAAGNAIAVFAVGAGETQPAIASGAAGAPGETYSIAVPQRAYVGGIPASEATVAVSSDLVGVYKMTLTIPELSGSTEAIHWISGGQVAAGVLGPVGAPEARYIDVPAEAASASRLDMTDLNPYYVALSGAIDETQGCYSGVHLLDLRRETSTPLSECLLPSFPGASNPNRFFRPFEAATNSSVLAALVVPEQAPESGATNRLLIADSGAGTRNVLTLASAAERLQPGEQGSRDLRLERPGGSGLRDVVDFSGTVVGESEGWVPLPADLEAGRLNRVVAQSAASFAGGYRIRFLAPEAPGDIRESEAILYNRTAEVAARLAFPEGWVPIQPPRRTNAQGAPVGNSSLAPVTTGFAGNTTAYVVVRKTDGTQDGVAAFQVALPADGGDESAQADATTGQSSSAAVSMTASVTAFPSGSFAATCHTAVRWQRIPLTRTIAIAGAGEALSAYADPRDDELCTSDRLVLFDTRTAATRVAMVPSAGDALPKLDIVAKGAVGSFLYFADGARESAYKAAEKIHVFDGATEEFSEIILPENAGLPFNNQFTQHLPGSGRIVALATGGNPRTTQRGTAPPYPGNQGLLVIDLPGGTATHLALPDSVQRAIPGTNRMVQDGRRMFGLIPLLDRAFGVFRRRNNPGGSAVVTWDMATLEAREIALPENGYSVVQPFTTGGSGPNQFVWDYSGKNASFAFGVYDQPGTLIAIGVVGP